MFKHRKTSAPAPPIKKALPVSQNGNTQSPIIYNEAPSDDENMNAVPEENVLLTVLLPGGKTSTLDISNSTPMMDILVNIAARNKLNPGAHCLRVTNDDTGKVVDYKPNSAIGSLGGVTVQLLAKKGQTPDKAKAGGKNKPFEVTMRLTVNFPRNQRKVLRVNPSWTMMEIFRTICQDKDIDQSQYELRLLNAPDDSLNMAWTLADYNVNEINLVAMKVPDFRSATNEIISQQKVINTLQPEKKKKGFFSFLRKDKKSKHPPPQKEEISSDIRLQKDQTMYPPTKPQAEVRPQPHIERIVAPPVSVVKKSPAKSTKKRHAPPPPTQPAARLPSLTSQTSVTSPTLDTRVLTSTPENSVPVPAEHEAHFVRSNSKHSRHSSDSSGYHEASVTESPSPDTSKAQMSVFKTSLDNSSLESSELNNSDGLSPHAMSPRLSTQYMMARRARSEENLLDVKESGSHYRSMDNLMEGTSPSAGKGPRKKRRAPPPPGVIMRETSEPVKERPHTMAALTDVSDRLLTKTRPCSFIPPPPPDSPPPPLDEMPKDDSPRTQQQHDMEVALASSNEEFKNPAQSRSESRCSGNSVNTIDDITLHFDDAIAAGELSLDEDKRADEISNYVQQIQDMTKNLSDIQPIAVDVGDVHDSDSDTESVTHRTDASNSSGGSDHYSVENNRASQVLPDSMEPVQLIAHTPSKDEVIVSRRDSMQSNDSDTAYFEEEWDSDTNSWKRVTTRKGLKIDLGKDLETSEITYDFQVDNVPTPFQSEDEFTFGNLKRTDSEETLTGDSEDVAVEDVPARDDKTPVPPEETNVAVQNVVEETKEQPVAVEKTVVEKPVVMRKPVVVEKPVVTEVKPREPEEFTITPEDRKSIYMVPSLQRATSEPVARSPTQGKIVEVSGSRRTQDEEAFYGNDGSVRGLKGQVRSRMSELNFNLHPATESEVVLEEKSLSHVVNPVVRSPAKPLQYSSNENVNKKDSVSQNARPTGSVNISAPVVHRDPLQKRSSISSFVLKPSPVRQEPKPVVEQKKTTLPVHKLEVTSQQASKAKTSPLSVREVPSKQASQPKESPLSSGETQSLLQAQYNQLQVQFAMWQQQLIQNQETLAKKKIAPQDQALQLQGLQEQMELQQQMMLQLQQNMQSLQPSQPKVKGQEEKVKVEKEMLIIEKKPDVTVHKPEEVKVQRRPIVIQEKKMEVRAERPKSAYIPSTKVEKRQEVKTERPKTVYVPPSPPVITQANVVSFKANLKPVANRQLSTDERFGPKLTPRELLLQELGNSGGITCLKETGNFQLKTSSRFEAGTMDSKPVSVPIQSTSAPPTGVPQPPPPPPSMGPPAVKPKTSVPPVVTKPPRKQPPANRFEQQLDPREELMIAIRGMGGHVGLRKASDENSTDF